ncbi:hypothetical protein [Limosilactobacillus fastidiosus]|uniref:Arc family DNA-binding protein n=1 Tax=Limosilactobacillus fastidiosus TaxID=2759855 RepID=A0A7W3YD50_9LACO|nr:hypothetical protein [Limosilactobacillus fastidiosus]MBB1086687.1 hypothetical protein [Limosilactobacillus fastidiosus]MCD7085586.1 hypothetical protein [Limosilactobacillus fastidiosus]MCD7114817.1 hypothetical protein [Limosilactobacillus fastidiosus]MCD7115934.1 hypothetical protein [Limosilactobacillus fastidiosus]
MADDKFTKEEDKRFTLRINKDIFEMVEREAKEERRSIGRQIEFILAQHFDSENKE